MSASDIGGSGCVTRAAVYCCATVRVLFANQLMLLLASRNACVADYPSPRLYEGPVILVAVAEPGNAERATGRHLLMIAES